MNINLRCFDSALLSSQLRQAVEFGELVNCRLRFGLPSSLLQTEELRLIAQLRNAAPM
jgi:hypothetical protein